MPGYQETATNVINVHIPREFVSKNDAKKFSKRHTFNGLIVKSKSNIRERISLYRDDHELSLRSIGSEMIHSSYDKIIFAKGSNDGGLRLVTILNDFKLFAINSADIQNMR